jgi:hypothetical protein
VNNNLTMFYVRYKGYRREVVKDYGKSHHPTAGGVLASTDVMA